jgi:hypothetical protein
MQPRWLTPEFASQTLGLMHVPSRSAIPDRRGTLQFVEICLTNARSGNEIGAAVDIYRAAGDSARERRGEIGASVADVEDVHEFA